MNKIATSIQQSEFLISKGVPVETADMFYSATGQYLLAKQDYSMGPDDIPAWSLSALMELHNGINLSSGPNWEQIYEGYVDYSDPKTTEADFQKCNGMDFVDVAFNCIRYLLDNHIPLSNI